MNEQGEEEKTQQEAVAVKEEEEEMGEGCWRSPVTFQRREARPQKSWKKPPLHSHPSSQSSSWDGGSWPLLVE